jgi:hypothetical protein
LASGGCGCRHRALPCEKKLRHKRQTLKGRVLRVDEIFLAKIFHFYSHSVPNGTGDGGGGALFLPTFRP